MHIVQAKASHVPDILDIVNHEIEFSTSIYDYDPRTLAEQMVWFEEKQQTGIPVFVAEEDNMVLGFATYGSFRTKVAYQFTVEHSIYIHKDARGQGIGKALMVPLIEAARANGKHTMIAGIDAANVSSIHFHQQFGFQEVGRIREAGFKFEKWLDLVFMQLML
ncbi:MAG: N-acetyltransferase [Saprospiraceae bacterium]|nr:N-acetyltransferase [Saprospiraceae bacterium]